MESAIPTVAVQSVRKVFGRHPALSSISFSLTPGRAALLLGPNGAGKSTLLSILSTLSRPSGGEVLYGEHGHAHAERHLRGRIGLLSHEPMLYPRMSCRENLMFFARLYRVEAPERTVDRWLSRVQMQEASGRPVDQLSRGMMQRVSLARTLLPDPDLLLLDEPFTGLDRDGVAALREELRALAGERDRIILVVTHDLEAVDGLCDHMIVLDRGHLSAEHEEPGLSQSTIQERYHAAL